MSTTPVAASLTHAEALAALDRVRALSARWRAEATERANDRPEDPDLMVRADGVAAMLDHALQAPGQPAARADQAAADLAWLLDSSLPEHVARETGGVVTARYKNHEVRILGYSIADA